MADTKISELTSGSPLQSTDDIPVARSGANRRVRIDLSAYATSAQGALADSAQQPPAEGPFVDGDKTKLDGIEANATADQTDTEIATAYGNQVAAASQAEAEAGTEAAIRRFSPLRVKQAIDALSGGGGTPGGSDGQVQFNASGSFSADAGLAYNSTTKALTVGGATVTTDSPVLNLAQTWNEGATTFTALKLNVTDTASNASSQLMDLQVGAASKLSVNKSGNLLFGTGGGSSAPNIDLTGTLVLRGSSGVACNTSVGSWGSFLSATSLALYGGRNLAFSGGNGAPDAYINRDDANILAQRNGTNPQTFRLANTWTNASNLEQLSIGWSANVCTIGTEALGTGTKRNLVLDGANRAAYSETAADIAAALVAHGIMSPA